MRGNYWKKLMAFLPMVVLAALPALAQQMGDPIADAARKARAQEKIQPKPKKIYTDDDFKPAAPPPAATPAKGAEGASDQTGAAGQAAGKAKEDPNGEAAWRKRFADQRAKIAKAQEELDVMQRELNKSQVQYYPNPQTAMNQQYSRGDINKKTAAIAAKKQEIEKLNSELNDMEDQLRKSGGDPGWARP